MRVRLMPEYECDFPVWINSEESAPSSIHDEALRSRIERWNSLFLTSFDAETGWTDAATRDGYAEEGRSLFAALKKYFGESADVTYDAWPLT